MPAALPPVALPAMPATSFSKPVLSHPVLVMEKATRDAMGRVAKGAITLGALTRLQELQDAWDGITPSKLPFDPEEPVKEKFYETLESFMHKDSGFTSVMPVVKAGGFGADAFESLARVVVSMPANLEYQDRPLFTMVKMLKAGNYNRNTCTESDVEFVLQLVIYRTTCHNLASERGGGGSAMPYAGFDCQLLDYMRKKMPVEFTSRLEKWGLNLAQLFVDFFRHMGEYAMNFHFEKRIVFDRAFIAGFLRNMPLVTRMPIRNEVVLHMISRETP